MIVDGRKTALEADNFLAGLISAPPGWAPRSNGMIALIAVGFKVRLEPDDGLACAT